MRAYIGVLSIIAVLIFIGFVGGGIYESKRIDERVVIQKETISELSDKIVELKKEIKYQSEYNKKIENRYRERVYEDQTYLERRLKEKCRGKK